MRAQSHPRDRVRMPGQGQQILPTLDVVDPDIAAIAADGNGVWLAQGNARVEGSAPMLGLYHFDGLTRTRYEDDVEVLDVAAATDGTVWHLADQEPYVLRPLEL